MTLSQVCNGQPFFSFHWCTDYCLSLKVLTIFSIDIQDQVTSLKSVLEDISLLIQVLESFAARLILCSL